MRVAVTGASGFVGRHVSLALAARGHHVVGFGTRAPDATTAALPAYRRWDITGDLDGAPVVDAVVHCAAHVTDWGDESRFRAVNVEGTRRVLATFPAARFVHVSTSSVYSDGVRAVRVREDAPAGDCAHSAYARTKAAAERVVQSLAPDAVILRPHAVYGPGDTTLVPRLLAARRFGRLCLPGDGTSRVSVTYVGNLALAVAAALERPAVSGIFNIADVESIDFGTLVRLVLRRSGLPDDVLFIPAPLARSLATLLEAAWRTGRLGGAPPLSRYVVKHLTAEHTLDITRARDLLGYAPGWRIEDAAFA